MRWEKGGYCSVLTKLSAIAIAIASGGRDSPPQPDKSYVAEGKPQN